MELTDYEVIQKCLAGQQQYFEELVTRYKKLIFSVVYNMINDKEEVSDISQEVFIRIYKALGRYNPEYKFSTWAVRLPEVMVSFFLSWTTVRCRSSAWSSNSGPRFIVPLK